jgi:hypothetical protein
MEPFQGLLYYWSLCRLVVLRRRGGGGGTVRKWGGRTLATERLYCKSIKESAN